MKFGKTLVAIATAVISYGALAKPAQAQLGTTFVAVGEFDTEETYLAFVGVSVSPRREGWSWVAGANAYWLQYPLGNVADDHRSVTAIVPSVGIKNTSSTGSFSARVGYAITSTDNNSVSVPVFSPEGAGSGVTTSAQYDYWGTGAMSAQAIGSYNFGSESFWGRGRLGFRVAKWDRGALTIGPEFGYQNSEDYKATKIGGVIGLNPGPGTQINAAIGRKMVSNNSNANATYFGIEFVLYPH